MDKKVYEKTRYQNIYRHKKNKNYLIMMSKPVKTSISTIDGKKIMKLEDALKIRDNPKIKVQKGLETVHKEDFDSLWCIYIDECKNVKKLAYNTLNKKDKIYNKYLKDSFKIKVSKIKRENITSLLNNANTTNKQKNEILEELKAFFNWCVDEEYLLYSPIKKIKNFKTEKSEMNYWTPEELKIFLNVLDNDIVNNIDKDVAYRIKIFTLIEFSLGNRVGETRALTFDCFDSNLGTVSIKHSINYDTSSNNFLSDTKNYHSQRNIDISDKLINEIEKYKQFLIESTEYDIKNNDMIFFNYSTKRPYSDVTLRKAFHKYCDKANVKKIRMYDLRHTYVATMMSEGKELYYISGRIGHSNYSTTVNKYGHLSNEKRKEIATLTDKYI